MSNMWTFTFVLVAIIAEVYSQQSFPYFDTTHLLQVQKGKFVEIELELWMHPDTPGAPCADEEYLEIRDGYNQSGNLLGVFCGRYVPPFKLRSSGRNMWLRFSPRRRYRLWRRYYEGKALNATYTTNLKNVAKTHQFVLLNHSSSLWCPAEGGPAPRIVWRKNDAVVQNSTSVRLQINVTEEERITNYSCEVDDQMDKKNISLVVEKCPRQCQCKVLKGNMKNLVSADCGTKQLKSIPEKIPRATGKLTLSNNKLKHLPKEVFSRNSNLIKLNLSSNQLQHLTRGVFAGIKVSYEGMLTLDLSNNQLKNLSSGVFTGISVSQYASLNLDLSNNKLQDLPPRVFAGIHTSEGSKIRLDLTNNQLKNLSSGVFTGISISRYASLNLVV